MKKLLIVFLSTAMILFNISAWVQITYPYYYVPQVVYVQPPNNDAACLAGAAAGLVGGCIAGFIHSRREKAELKRLEKERQQREAHEIYLQRLVYEQKLEQIECQEQIQAQMINQIQNTHKHYYNLICVISFMLLILIGIAIIFKRKRGLE